MKRKVGIIGKGNVGSALKKGLERAGYEVRTTGKGGARETAAWGEVLIFAVPYTSYEAVLKEIGSAADGKTLLDASNPLGSDGQLVVGHTSSAAEEIQKKAPKVHVAKCFNTVFAAGMDTGTAKGEQMSAFVACDDEKAKAEALELARAIGFDAVDCGPLKNARWIEALGYLNIQLGYPLKMGTGIGIRLIH